MHWRKSIGISVTTLIYDIINYFLICLPLSYVVIRSFYRSDLRFGVEQGVDMVFASFIRKAADVQAVREVLGEEGKNIMVCCYRNIPYTNSSRIN